MKGQLPVICAFLGTLALCAFIQISVKNEISLAERKQVKTILWENYFPSKESIQSRFERVKKLVKVRNMENGLPADFVPKGRKSQADPIVFCRKNFPAVSYFDQDEFNSCLQALNVPEVQLQTGESTQAQDIAGTPAGRNQPDGPNSLSPGSAGWSRW